MKEVNQIVYVAEDGTTFLVKASCIAYEEELKKRDEIINCYDNIIDYCSNNYSAYTDSGACICKNEECPFYNDKARHNCIFECIPTIDMEKLGE